MANQTHSLDLGLHLFSESPSGCAALVFHDGIGVSFPRSIVV